MFHMLDEGEPDPEFGDFVRIFGKHREDIDVLPQKTSLQRGFAKYLEDGNMAGRGFGICLFDGEKIRNREITNILHDSFQKFASFKKNVVFKITVCYNILEE